MDALKSKGQMYDQINLEQIPRSGFDLSHSVRGTGKIGRLIPIRNMETQPVIVSKVVHKLHCNLSRWLFLCWLICA